MATHTQDEDDRRSRRAFWFGGLVALVFALVIGLLGFTGIRGGTDSGPGARAAAGGTEQATGTGRAPVYSALPEDPDESADLPSSPDAPAPTGAAVSRPAPHEGTDRDAVAPTERPVRPHGIALVLSSELNAPLRPGIRRTLTVSVRNPNGFPVDLHRLDVRVGTPPSAGCLSTWVRVARWRDSAEAKRRIGGRTTIKVALPITFVDLPTVNQNACQGTTFPLTLSGVAVDAA